MNLSKKLPSYIKLTRRHADQQGGDASMILFIYLLDNIIHKARNTLHHLFIKFIQHFTKSSVGAGRANDHQQYASIVANCKLELYLEMVSYQQIKVNFINCMPF